MEHGANLLAQFRCVLVPVDDGIRKARCSNPARRKGRETCPAPPDEAAFERYTLIRPHRLRTSVIPSTQAVE